MSKTYRPYEPDQMFLLPPSLTDWLPPDHLVFFVRDVLDTIDLSPITRVYEEEGRGYPPYHPKMMTGILLYGYCSGVFSSRKLALRCQEDVPFRVLAANNQPDFRTMSDFRKRHLPSLQHVFVEVLRLCQEAGLVKFAHIALDGTKIKANASKHKAMSYGRMKQDIKRLQGEISHLLELAQETDDREDRLYGHDVRGDELPAELARRETRLARLQEAKRALEKEAREQRNDRPPPPSASADLPKATIKTEPHTCTNKPRPVEKAQRNFTDPDSRILPYQKTFVQGYNAQLAVDGARQIIVATDVSNTATDDVHLPSMVARLPNKPKVFSVDAGYTTPENIRYLNKKRYDAYMATRREKHHWTSGPAPRGALPQHLSPEQRMERKLFTKKGRRIYSRRKCIVEPPIGHIKHVLGFRQFSLRGHDKVRAEWFLVTAVHNLKKLFQHWITHPTTALAT